MGIAEASPSSQVSQDPPPVPSIAKRYKDTLIREARYQFGINAPIATMAAQIHTESLWKHDARSWVGAEGLTQFMPETAKWIGQIDSKLKIPNPNNPEWAIRALCVYNKWHEKRVKGKTEADTWAFILCAYNGGLGWVYRDQKKAKAIGLDDTIYFNSVEHVNAGRRASAFKENRNYITHIKKREPIYTHALWGRGVFE